MFKRTSESTIERILGKCFKEIMSSPDAFTGILAAEIVGQLLTEERFLAEDITRSLLFELLLSGLHNESISYNMRPLYLQVVC